MVMSTKKKTAKKKKTAQAKVKKSIDAIKAEAESNRKNSTPTSKKKTTKKKTQKKKVVKKKTAKKSENIQKSKKKSKKKKVYKNKGGNGGKRSGSGRKKGAATTKTREIADKLADDGELTPLEYMLGVLRETSEKLKARFDAGEIDSAEYIVELQAMQKRKDNAAEKAAPYIHPRLSAIEANIKDNAHEKWLALMEDDK